MGLLTTGACSDSSPEAPTPRPGTEGWACPNDNNCLQGLRCIAGTCQPSANDAGPRPDAVGLGGDAGQVADLGPRPDAVDLGGDAGNPCQNPSTLSYIQTNIFGPSGQGACNQAVCHGQGAAGSLQLTGPLATVRAALLEPTRDRTAPEASIVVPGDPGASRLFVVMRDPDPAGTGGPMPPQGAVPFCDLEAVRRWIAEGALAN